MCFLLPGRSNWNKITSEWRSLSSMAPPYGGESWQCCRRARKVQAAHRCQVLCGLGRAEDQLLVGDHRRRGCCGRISSLRTPTGREVDGARDSRLGCTRSRFERPEYLSSCSRSKPSLSPSSLFSSSSWSLSPLSYRPDQPWPSPVGRPDVPISRR